MTTPNAAVVVPPTTPAVPHLIGLVGLPGEGKSHFARSARACGKTAIALTDPKELTFYGPEGVTMFSDFDWRPHAGEWKATAMIDLLRWMDAQGKSDAEYVVIDTGSEVSDLARHEALKVHATDNLMDVGYGKAHAAHDGQMKAFINECRRLVVRGKTVIVTFHAHLKEMEGQGDAKKTKGMTGEMEWTFDEQMLPALNTKYRSQIHGAFDLWLYMKPQGFGPARKWFMTAQADAVRPAKHSVRFKAGTNLAMIPNDMTSLRNILDEGTK